MAKSPTQTTYKTREEWLEARKQGIGGSEVAAILGENKWESAYSLWCKKLGLYVEDFTDTPEIMKWGNRLEKAIATAVATDYNMDVMFPRAHTIWKHRVYPNRLATLDAIQFEKGQAGGEDAMKRAGVLQIKNCGEYNKKSWADGPPKMYWIQVQYEMDVAAMSWGSLAVLIGGNRMLPPFVLKKDDEFLNSIDTKLNAFWKCVVDQVPPEIDDSEATMEAYLQQAVGKDVPGKVHIITEEENAVFEELEKIKEQSTVLKERERILKFKAQKIVGLEAVQAIAPNGDVWGFSTVHRSGYTVEPTSYRQVTKPRGKNKKGG